MVIWKYELSIKDSQQINIPQGAKILSVANQNGKLCMWALVDPLAKETNRFIEIIGTGNPILPDEKWQRVFIGTVLMGSFVWHVFELLNE